MTALTRFRNLILTCAATGRFEDDSNLTDAFIKLRKELRVTNKGLTQELVDDLLGAISSLNGKFDVVDWTEEELSPLTYQRAVRAIARAILALLEAVEFEIMQEACCQSTGAR